MAVAAPGTVAPAWLLRMRTVSVAGVLLLVLVADLGLGLDLPLHTVLPILAAWMATNLVGWWLTRGHDGAMSTTAAASLLLLDAVFLTAVFHQTGGPSNPFSFFFLVHLALAAMVLPSRWAWTLVAVSVGLFGLLFLDHVPLRSDPDPTMGAHAGHMGSGDGGHDMAMHLRGMWVAFATAAVFIVFFVSRLARALEDQGRALAKAQAQAARSERLASLATLAAGAAHELATPLSTIAVVAGELRRDLETGDAPDAVDDVALIQGQVDRCREVLDALRVDAGDPGGEAPDVMPLAVVVERALTTLAHRDRVRVALGPAGDARVRVFPRGLPRAVRGLVKNALDASPADATVDVSGTVDPEGVHLMVADRGTGMDPLTLERVGEPFWTTKPAGQGMGLGVFLARTLAERLGGDMAMHSEPGTGTRVTLTLPPAKESP